MANILSKAELPTTYDNYVFDLYGTLVDIHTDEENDTLWEKLSLLFGYYGALYEPKVLRRSYENLVLTKENEARTALTKDPRYSHEAFPELEIMEIFNELYAQKGVKADENLSRLTGQFYRILATDYIKLYPGTERMLQSLKNAGKKIYLLSNAQRIFTAYELNTLDITKYFDGILISSDHKTKKPDKRFFDILLNTYKLEIAGSLFVGNDSRTDINGAKQVKMDTYYVKSNISPQNDMAETADYIVTDFTKWDY